MPESKNAINKRVGALAKSILKNNLFSAKPDAIWE